MILNPHIKPSHNILQHKLTRYSKHSLDKHGNISIMEWHSRSGYALNRFYAKFRVGIMVTSPHISTIGAANNKY